jgi:omega-amidase
MQDLKVTIVQSDLHWQSSDANLAMFEEKIWKIEGQTDLIILPEMFSTGFSMDASSLAEPMNFKSFKWMKQQAAQTNAVITGSIIIKDGGNFYNRLFWVEPSGSYDYYDKRHLFRMAEEHHHYSPGNKRIIKSLKGWKVLPLICYDLRFPVWSRNRSLNGEPEYDLLLYVANWPAARITAWDSLLRARAIENLSFTIGVNRTGTDGKGIEYNGHSSVFNYKGEEIFSNEDEEVINTISLSIDELKSFRDKFPAYLDSDSFEIIY